MARPLVNARAFRPGTSFDVASIAVSTASAAFGASVQLIRVIATQPCRISIGVAPVAVAGQSTYLPADKAENFVVSGGDKIAVIQNAVAGVLNVTPVES